MKITYLVVGDDLLSSIGGLSASSALEEGDKVSKGSANSVTKNSCNLQWRFASLEGHCESYLRGSTETRHYVEVVLGCDRDETRVGTDKQEVVCRLAPTLDSPPPTALKPRSRHLVPFSSPDHNYSCTIIQNDDLDMLEDSWSLQGRPIEATTLNLAK